MTVYIVGLSMVAYGVNLRATNIASCKCKEGNTCTMCSTFGGSDLANLGGAVTNLLTKMHALMSKISSLSKVINVQSDRIHRLEGSSVTNGSGEENATRKRNRNNRKKKVRKSKLEVNSVSELSSDENN